MSRFSYDYRTEEIIDRLTTRRFKGEHRLADMLNDFNDDHVALVAGLQALGNQHEGNIEP